MGGYLLPYFGATCLKSRRPRIERENLLKGMVPDAIPLEWGLTEVAFALLQTGLRS